MSLDGFFHSYRVVRVDQLGDLCFLGIANTILYSYCEDPNGNPVFGPYIKISDVGFCA